MKTLKSRFWSGLLYSVLLVVLGFFVIAQPGITLAVLLKLISIVFIIFGCYRLFLYFGAGSHKGLFKSDLVIGLINIFIGVAVLVFPGAVSVAIPLSIGVFTVAEGISLIQTAFEIKGNGYEKWWGLLISGFLMIILGVVIIWAPFESMQFLMTLAGISLIADGIQTIYILFFLRRLLKTATGK